MLLDLYYVFLFRTADTRELILSEIRCGLDTAAAQFEIIGIACSSHGFLEADESAFQQFHQ